MKIKKIVACMAAATGISLASSSASADTMTLKLSGMAPEKNPVVQCSQVGIAKQIAERSGGRIEWQNFFAGTAFSHPAKQYEQLAKGITDMSMGVLTYLPGRFPMTNIGTLPFLFDSHVEAAEVMTQVYQEMLQEEFPEVHLMALIVPPLYQIHTKDPVNSIDDMQGMRLRAAGVTHNKIMKSLGAVPAPMPAPQLYENLSKGVIDGTFFPWSGMVSWKLGEVTEHTVDLDLNAAMMFFAMSKKTYNGLPDDIKAIVDDISGPSLARHVGECWSGVDAKGEQIARGEGRTVSTFSDAEMARLKSTIAPITEDYLADLEGKGLPARKVYARIQELAAD